MLNFNKVSLCDSGNGQYDIVDLGNNVKELRDSVRDLVSYQKKLRQSEALISLRSVYIGEERRLLNVQIRNALKLYKSMHADYLMMYHITMRDMVK